MVIDSHFNYLTKLKDLRLRVDESKETVCMKGMV